MEAETKLSFIWEEDGEGTSILGVYGDSSAPVLPAAIGGRPVTRIGRYCFAPRGREPDGKGVHRTGSDFSHRIDGDFPVKITLPDSVRILDNAAFYPDGAFSRGRGGDTDFLSGVLRIDG